MDDDEIERDIGRELDETQAAVAAAKEAPVKRRAAVMRAKEHGWSKYKIAARLGVKGPTVDAIIESAQRAVAAERGRQQDGAAKEAGNAARI